MGEHGTTPDDQTREVDARDASLTAQPDDMPTPEEERLAEDAAAQAPDVGDEYEAALRRGANVRGEGAIEP